MSSFQSHVGSGYQSFVNSGFQSRGVNDRWVRVGSGIDYQFESLIEFEGKVVVGWKAFDSGVLSWDGLEWSGEYGPVPRGMEGSIYAYGDSLITCIRDARVPALSDTTSSIGIRSPAGAWSGIGVFSGGSRMWQDMWFGLTYDGSFYACGDSVGSVWTASPTDGGTPIASLNSIGAYDLAGGWRAVGQSSELGWFWSQAGPPPIFRMAEFQGSLYVVGSLDRFGKTWAGYDFLVNHVAKWNGSVWSPLDEGVRATAGSANAKDLVVYDGRLIVGGRFDTASGTPAPGLAAWDGSSWSDVFGRMDVHDVTSLAVWGDRLVFSGQIVTGEGLRQTIQAWDGFAWREMVSGLGIPRAIRLISVDGVLYALIRSSGAGNYLPSTIRQWSRRQ